MAIPVLMGGALMKPSFVFDEIEKSLAIASVMRHVHFP